MAPVISESWALCVWVEPGHFSRWHIIGVDHFSKYFCSSFRMHPHPPLWSTCIGEASGEISHTNLSRSPLSHSQGVGKHLGRVQLLDGHTFCLKELKFTDIDFPVFGAFSRGDAWWVVNFFYDDCYKRNH